MPYYLFKISTRDELQMIKHLELVQLHDTFKAAKTEARALRAEQQETDIVFKVMFAKNQLEAEESLLERREKPVLMEHER